MKLSKTEKMWVARLRKAPRVLQYSHDAVKRLVNRGLAKVSVEFIKLDSGHLVARRVLSLA